MDFDFSTLITDRSASDLELLRDLLSTPMSDWTAEQLAQFNQALSKGAYNYTDLNRVTACMDYLNERLTALGYVTGYQRIVVHPDSGGTTLPEGYVELEYIQSSGTQYINSGVFPNQDSKVEARYQCSQTSSGGIFVSNIGWENTGFGVWVNAAAYGNSVMLDTVPLYGPDPLTVILDKGTLYKDGAQVWQGSAGNFQVPYVMTILALNRSGSISEYATATLYYCKIYDNNALVRDFVPCKDPSGAVGLYDLVGDDFYGNAGTGSFTAGPEIPRPEPMDPYTWYESDVPTASSMTSYLANVSALRETLTLPGDTVPVPGDMSGLTQAEANNIETVLDIINDYLEAMMSIFRRCGAAVCGGPGSYFVN